MYVHCFPAPRAVHSQRAASEGCTEGMVRSAYAYLLAAGRHEQMNSTAAHALVSLHMLPASARSTCSWKTNLLGLQTHRHTPGELRRFLQTGQWGSWHKSPQFCWTACALSHSCQSDQSQPAKNRAEVLVCCSECK